MAKILVKNSVTSGSAPAGLSLGEIAVNITDKKIFFGNAVESAVAVYDRNAHVLSFNGSTGAVTFVNYVASVNGSTGAITNVAVTNAAQTFSGLQSFSTGISAASILAQTVGGDEGGQVDFGNPVTNTSLTGGVAIDIYQNRMRFFEKGGTARGYYIDLTAGAAGAGTNLVGGGGGGVAGVSSLNGITGAVGITFGKSIHLTQSGQTLTIGISAAQPGTTGTIQFNDGSGGLSASTLFTYTSGTLRVGGATRWLTLYNTGGYNVLANNGSAILCLIAPGSQAAIGDPLGGASGTYVLVDSTATDGVTIRAKTTTFDRALPIITGTNPSGYLSIRTTGTDYIVPCNPIITLQDADNDLGSRSSILITPSVGSASDLYLGSTSLTDTTIRGTSVTLVPRSTHSGGITTAHLYVSGGATFIGNISAPNIVNSVNGITGPVGIAAGTNITISASGKTLTISSTASGGGGGAGFTYASSAPSSPAIGDRWIDSDTGKEYVYVYDGSSSQWIEPTSSNGLAGLTYYSATSLYQFGGTGSFVKLGVGTTAPANTLDVSGGVSVSTTTNALDILASSDGAGMRIAQATSGAGSRIGGIRLGRNATASNNTYIESATGVLSIYNGIDQTGTNMFNISTSGGAVFSTPVSSTGAVTSDGGYRITSSAINALTGTTYTLLSTDNGKVITWSNASGVTLTVPSGLPVGFNTTIIQIGAGSVGITGSGVTLNSFEGKLRLAGQHAAVTIISYASNIFNVAGGLTGL